MSINTFWEKLDDDGQIFTAGFAVGAAVNFWLDVACVVGWLVGGVAGLVEAVFIVSPLAAIVYDFATSRGAIAWGEGDSVARRLCMNHPEVTVVREGGNVYIRMRRPPEGI